MVSAFLVVTLLDLWSITPPLLHRVLLGAFGLALAFSFLPLIRLSLPTREEALRRLERKANIKHRPATSYEDRLGTTPAKDTALLWAAHRKRLSRLIDRLRPRTPLGRSCSSASSPRCSPPAAIAGIGCARPSPRQRAAPRPCSGSMPG